MNVSRNNKTSWSSIKNLDASRQASLSILLLTVMPALISFFSGHYMAGQKASLPYAALLGLLAISLIIPGYMILKKYPDNITQIRNFVTEITEGYLPNHVTLQRTYESDDLRYIEQSLNTMLDEMKKQQEYRVKAEHHRTVVESVSILIEKISRPLDIIRKSLIHLDVIALMEEEHADITRCQKELEHISKDIRRLMGSKEIKKDKSQLNTTDTSSSQGSLLENTADCSSIPCNPATVGFNSKPERSLVAA